MLSNLPRSGFMILLWTVALSGCTEKLPLAPVYSNNSNWTPVISIDQNGYQRVEVLIERPTEKDLWRNISYLTVQARTNSAQSSIDIDTIRGSYVAPTDVYGLNLLPAPFVTKPRLEFATDYSLRTAAHFGTGEIHFSNEVAVRTPPRIGRVLSRLKIPGNTPSILFISFYRGSLLALAWTQVLQLDTATGHLTTLKVSFSPPNNAGGYLSAFSILGDTAYSFYRLADDYTKSRLVSLDLGTLRVDSSVTISTPGQLVSMISHKGALYAIWGTSDGNDQSGIIDTRTGAVSQISSAGPAIVPLPGSLCSDGTNVFLSRNQTFDNRILTLDLTTMHTIKEDRNPIFSAECLAWDGENFWVVDYETYSFTKIRLEGI